MTAPLLEVRGVSRRFPGVLALDGVSLQLAPGEVLAVIGENGAGKSTLMKILAGVQQADEGEVLLEGRPVRFGSVREAQQNGIALIHQELNLADNLSVGANIFLGSEPHRIGLIDFRAIEQRSAALLQRVGLQVSPRTLVHRLSPGRQQLVEIAKALSLDARVLIMDEPTSSLSQAETERLYEVIRELSAAGVAVIYISHRLGEVKELAHRVTVLRDGKNAGELAKDEIRHDAMVRLMVGRDVVVEPREAPGLPTEPRLRVRNLVSPEYPEHKVSFEVFAGEIVGLAGLVGAGRTELLHTLFGVTPALGGSIELEGQALAIRHPLDAIRAGMALAPEDRKGQGLVLEMAIRENASLAAVRRDQRWGLLDFAAERALAKEAITRLNVRTPNDRKVVRLLSGGNQQKVVLGKWLALSPKLLLLDEPTRGIDVGAKQEIYRIMRALAEEGVAILFVSSEMEEVLQLSDRALVMHEGRISGALDRRHLTEEAVMALATGARHPEGVPA
ncbi:MAG: ATP-binding cassette domain-containing protein [Candidatus Hydrogenedens sp.]|nr:ATP-binding cassette domain-containing protein [Candidatus Hydrogenedens sp.]